MPNTHAIIWYLLERALLSPAATAAMTGAIDSGGSIFVPSIAFAEIVYLSEKGRLPGETLARILSHVDQVGGQIITLPLDSTVAQAVARVARADVPDMPDRIIAASALVLDVPLVTRDHRIRAANVKTIW